MSDQEIKPMEVGEIEVSLKIDSQAHMNQAEKSEGSVKIECEAAVKGIKMDVEKSQLNQCFNSLTLQSSSLTTKSTKDANQQLSLSPTNTKAEETPKEEDNTEGTLPEEKIWLRSLIDKLNVLLSMHGEVNEKLVSNLEALFLESQEQCLKEDKAMYWYQLGRFYAATSEVKSKAIEPLSKAVKLNPLLYEAWNELGDCYWHCNEIDLAQNCFENAMSSEHKKVPLRSLSIIMRRLAACDEEQRPHYITKGVDFARDAVRCDVKDGLSWGILGNAYQSAYFCFAQDITYAKLALSAYKQAENLPSGILNTELYFNKAHVSKYLESYDECLTSLDKALSFEHKWEPAISLKEDLIKYLDDVQRFTDTKGKIKPRNLNKLKTDLLMIQKKTDFGNKPLIDLIRLKEGSNRNICIMGKVIWNIAQFGSFPFTFGMIDTDNNPIIVTVYNLTPGKGFIIGDTIRIFDPIVISIDFSYDEKRYGFKSIRIEDPTLLHVNKKKLPSTYFTPYSLVTLDKDML